ncbi:MAG: PD-(D/E)XK nuclease-like domain-containing protein [bacterium]|nr:PD-(D/E)XK nuclease-like domain-containing protein [bacterium]
MKLKRLNYSDYDAIPALRNTELREWAKSPRHWKLFVEQGFRPTKSMSLGSLVDTRILSPNEWDRDYYVQPADASVIEAEILKCRRYIAEWEAKAGQKNAAAKIDEWTAKLREAEDQARAAMDGNENKIAVTVGNGTIIDACFASVLENADAKAILESSHAQMTLEFEFDGVPCKARYDLISDEGGITITDLKSASNASKIAFQWDFKKYLYWCQVGFYALGVLEETGTLPVFKFIVVETNEPYNTGVYTVQPGDVIACIAEVRRLIRAWRDRPENPREIDLMHYPSGDLNLHLGFDADPDFEFGVIY